MSMIEVMVAISILSFVFIGLVQVFPFGLSVSKEAEQTTTASFLAQQEVEQLNSLGYDNISVGVLETKHRLSNDQSSYLYYYQRQTQVSYVDSDLNDSATDMGLKKISVDIFYNSAFLKSESDYNITTLLSKL